MNHTTDEKGQLRELFEQEVSIQQRLDSLKTDLENERNKEKDLALELKLLETELKNKKAEYKKIEKEAQRFKRDFQTIQNSKMWKVLEPARKLGKLFKPVPTATEKVEKVTKVQSTSGNKVKKKNQNNSNNQQQKPWQKRAIKNITLLKKKLLDLGFTEKALAEFHALVDDTSKPYVRRLAARELSLWYANLRTEEGAQKCMELLDISLENETDEELIRKAAIMKAECLEFLGNITDAKAVIHDVLKKQQHPNLFLAAANLESELSTRFELVNKVLETSGINKITFKEQTDLKPYDRLGITLQNGKASVPMTASSPLVTIIMPTYNAADTIGTALDSILAQTWKNIEVIVYDDCSSDNTAEVVGEYEKKDPRVKFFKTEKNGGPYVARNLALNIASGEFVTVNDADDWSHPEKIETQVKHLLENPTVMGNTSQQARATSELKFYRRGNHGNFIFANVSSLMFRVKPVMEAIGYLHNVRFGADNEYIRRMRKVFGKEAVVDLPTGPLSFQRQSSGSLTGNSAFGYHGFLMGARKEYYESQNYHHEHSDSIYYDFAHDKDLMSIPEPMWPTRDGERYFDVILVSDFRLEEELLESNINEIKMYTEKGLKVGLIQMYKYNVDPRKKVSYSIRELVDSNKVQMIVYGEKVSCETIVINHVPLLSEWQKFIPEVTCNQVHVIIDETSVSDEKNPDLQGCVSNIERYFQRKAIWFPNSELTRAKFIEAYSNDAKTITLANENWSHANLKVTQHA